MNPILAKTVYPTHATASEIAESPTFLALRPLLWYTPSTMLYFSYGSNINLSHVNDFLGTHGVTLDTELRGQHELLHHSRLPLPLLRFRFKDKKIWDGGATIFVAEVLKLLVVQPGCVRPTRRQVHLDDAGLAVLIEAGLALDG